MNREQLKELVMQHFNLVDASKIPTPETFGSLEDVNKAFTLVFPGDAPKVGDKVKVVTSEGQEVEAPNGYHEMSDGTMIKTEGSVITEIEKKEEMSAVDPGDEHTEETKEEFGADPAKSKVEGTMPENKDTEINDKQKPNPSFEEVFAAVEEKIAPKMAELETKLAECMSAIEGMKGKFSAIASEPASERTLPTPTPSKENDFDTAYNSHMMKATLEAMKKKNK